MLLFFMKGLATRDWPLGKRRLGVPKVVSWGAFFLLLYLWIEDTTALKTASSGTRLLGKRKRSKFSGGFVDGPVVGEARIEGE